MTKCKYCGSPNKEHMCAGNALKTPFKPSLEKVLGEILDVLVQIVAAGEDDDNTVETATQSLLQAFSQYIKDHEPEKKPACGVGTINDDTQEWWCDKDAGFNEGVRQTTAKLLEGLK